MTDKPLVVKRDVDLADGVLADIYAPPEGDGGRAVIIAAGYPGKFKEMPSNKAWAERIAASGMTAIVYSNREPAADFLKVLRAVEADRIAVWACSGNVPVALTALTRNAPVRIACAAFLYGYMLDVEDAAAQFRFANPAVSIDDLDPAIPLFLARAGRDEMPRLNERLDSFVQQALARNVPITLVNHAAAPHAFDLSDDSEKTRQVIRHVLRFLSAGTGSSK